MQSIKKITAVFLAVLMIAVSVPVALAADPIALSQTNITEYTTVVYATDDEGNPLTLYYGMRTGDVISLTGGKVEYNGTEVPGHFELANPMKLQVLVVAQCGLPLLSILMIQLHILNSLLD